MTAAFARIFVGPLAFAIVQLIPLHGLSPAAHVAISCYAWVLAWWVAMPIPWAANWSGSTDQITKIERGIYLDGVALDD